MELEFAVISLGFAASPPFSFPRAVVRVQPAGQQDALSVASFDITLGLTGTVPAGAGPQQASEIAVRLARQLVLPSAAADLLAAMQADDTAARSQIAQRFPLP